VNPEAQRKVLAEACGWKTETYRNLPIGVPPGQIDDGGHECVAPLPDYLSDRNALFSALRHHGIHDPANLDIRVKYINTLREIVGRRMPKNKSGSPLTSDVDLLMAENEEIAEALLKILKKWKP
jgi:hypothetical protein